MSNSSMECPSIRPALIKLRRCLESEKSTHYQALIEVTSQEKTYKTLISLDTLNEMHMLQDLLASISNDSIISLEYPPVYLPLTLQQPYSRLIFSLTSLSARVPISNKPGCIRITVERTDTI